MANTTNNQFIVTGLFNDKVSAECAYDALSGRGYDKDSTDVMMSDKTRDQYYSGAHATDTELGSKAAEGTGAGAAIGGTLGAIIAGIAAIGTSVLLPGIGLIVAGPLAAALVGAGAGGIAGGIDRRARRFREFLKNTPPLTKQVSNRVESSFAPRRAQPKMPRLSKANSILRRNTGLFQRRTANDDNGNDRYTDRATYGRYDAAT